MARSVRSARVNDDDAKASSFFERQDHRESVISGVLGGVLPLKFAYAGSAAHTHDLLAQGADYQSVTGETTAVRDAMAATGLLGSDRIAEIGPGNGHATLQLLRLLGGRRKFLGLDFSETLLSIAESNFRRAAANTKFSSARWDVEAGPTDLIDQWRGDSASVPTLLLGNTIGNFEEPARALGNILESIGSGDVLFLGVTMQTAEPAGMSTPYDNEVFHDAALEPLRALGLDAELVVTYDEELTAVVGRAVLRKPVTVAEHDLPPGYEVRCFLSRRFADHAVRTIIKEAAGTVQAVTTDPAKAHAVFAVTKE